MVIASSRCPALARTAPIAPSTRVRAEMLMSTVAIAEAAAQAAE
jgi:hypothetical protein